jgi:hypothetical protein
MVEELTFRPAQLADFAFCQRTYLEPMRATIEKLGLDQASHLANFARRGAGWLPGTMTRPATPGRFGYTRGDCICQSVNV